MGHPQPVLPPLAAESAAKTRASAVQDFNPSRNTITDAGVACAAELRTDRPRSVQHIFRPCYGCKTPTRLCELNSEMLCLACGEPDPDPDNEEPSAAYLRRYEGTFSI